jgi:hypothetical protein
LFTRKFALHLLWQGRPDRKLLLYPVLHTNNIQHFEKCPIPIIPLPEGKGGKALHPFPEGKGCKALQKNSAGVPRKDALHLHMHGNPNHDIAAVPVARLVPSKEILNENSKLLGDTAAVRALGPEGTLDKNKPRKRDSSSSNSPIHEAYPLSFASARESKSPTKRDSSPSIIHQHSGQLNYSKIDQRVSPTHQADFATWISGSGNFGSSPPNVSTPIFRYCCPLASALTILLLSVAARLVSGSPQVTTGHHESPGHTSHTHYTHYLGQPITQVGQQVTEI